MAFGCRRYTRASDDSRGLASPSRDERCCHRALHGQVCAPSHSAALGGLTCSVNWAVPSLFFGSESLMPSTSGPEPLETTSLRCNRAHVAASHRVSHDEVFCGERYDRKPQPIFFGTRILKRHGSMVSGRGYLGKRLVGLGTIAIRPLCATMCRCPSIPRNCRRSLYRTRTRSTSAPRALVRTSAGKRTRGPRP